MWQEYGGFTYYRSLWHRLNLSDSALVHSLSTFARPRGISGKQASLH
jgi:hypothetical protein